jgi:branched-subunit amino acid transport protein
MDVRLLLPIWVVASIAISAGVTGWLYRGDGSRAEALQNSGIGQLVMELGSIMFCIAVPFVALLTGTISLDLLGLGRLWAAGDHTFGFSTGDWLRAIGEGLGATALAALALWTSRRGAGIVAPGDGPASAVLTAIKEESHWMFYRAPGALLFSDPLYGALSGFALMLFEWLLHPRFLTAHVARDNRWHLLTRLMCALVSGALYLGTRNLWIIFVAGAAIRIAAAAMTVDRQPKPIKQPAASV